MALTGLIAAIADVQGTVGALTGIREGPTYPGDKLPPLPSSFCFASSGEWKQQPAGYRTGLHTITLQIHWDRKDLARDVTKAMGFCETIPNAIMADPTLGSTVSTVVDPITYTFGMMEWAGMQTIGWSFNITVKIAENIT